MNAMPCSLRNETKRKHIIGWTDRDILRPLALCGPDFVGKYDPSSNALGLSVLSDLVV